MDQLAIIIKASRSSAFASLLGMLGSFDLAEDVIQEAIVRALVDWKNNEVPENPVAWLVQTARRYAIDVLRHHDIERKYQHSVGVLQNQEHWHESETGMSVLQLHDDQLRLIFTCCHPVLSIESQVALTLKTIVGLNVEEIARAYLLPVKTLEQRLTRAKRKIRDANIPYEIPTEPQIEARLEAVMSTIYLIYNQAYTCFKGTELLDNQLSEAGLYLAYMLNRLIRDNLEAQGLLALILLQHARAGARVDEKGLPVPLEEQARGLWDQNMINQGLVILEKCWAKNKPGPYQIQAAIAATHCRAVRSDETDWQEIKCLYELLGAVMPGPVVDLNRAIAVARTDGPEHGLQILDALEGHGQMKKFQYYHSARAALLEEMGRIPDAISAFRLALSLCENEAEQRYLTLKLSGLQQ